MRMLPVSKLLLRVLGPIQNVQRRTSVILLLNRADVMWQCCIGWSFRPATNNCHCCHLFRQLKIHAMRFKPIGFCSLTQTSKDNQSMTHLFLWLSA